MAGFTNNFGNGKGTTKGLWRLDGNSRDFSGNGNNGTDTGITYITDNGRRVASFTLGDNTSYIKIPFNASLLPSSTGTTYTFIFKTTGNGTNLITLMGHGNCDCSNGGFDFRLSAANSLYYTFNSFSNYNSGNTITLPYSVYDNNWHTLNLVANISGSGTLTVYLDGKFVTTNTWGHSIDVNSSDSYPEIVIGARYNTAVNKYEFCFGGQMKLVMIENYPIPVTEIARRYASTKNKFGETLYAPTKRYSPTNIIAAVSNFFYAFFNQ